MREIKFRAWHQGDKYGNDAEMLHGTTQGIFQWKADGQPIIIEQFTGLTDKNGVEIYEGDIVRIGCFYEGDPNSPDEDDRASYWADDSEHTVYWGGEYPAFDLTPLIDCDCNIFSHIANTDESIEVIGNIHEGE